MNRNILVVPLLLLLAAGTVSGQNMKDTRISGFLANMPQPSAGAEETTKQWNEPPFVESAFGKMADELQEREDRLFGLLYKNFLAAIENRKAGASLQPPSGSWEKEMMQRFRSGSAGMNEEGRFATFRLIMEDRPLVKTGKLPWAVNNPGFSTAAKRYYQQLLLVEGSFDWPGFKKEADDRDPVKQAFRPDDEINQLNEQFTEQQAEIPLVKVKPFEGMDTPVEIRDPQKTIRLIEITETKRKQILVKRYDELFQWWNKEIKKLRATAASMDILLDQMAADTSPGQTGSPLELTVADVEVRIAQALARMNGFAKKLVMDAQLIQYCDIKKAEMIAVYRKSLSGS